MSEPAYSRSSSPSLTAQVVLRRRAEGNQRRIKPRAHSIVRPVSASSELPSLPLASVTHLGPCIYCGRNSRDMACTAHRDLLVLDVGEARG